MDEILKETMEIDDTQITVGGHIGYKISAKPYESIDVSTVVSMKIGSTKDLDEKKLEQIEEGLRKLTHVENRRKMKEARKEYVEKMTKLKGTF